MRIEVNGTAHEVADGSTVADVLVALRHTGPGIAVALADEVVPRAQHATTSLSDGAALEVLTAVQGG